MASTHFVNDSELHMWRALFAFAFVDNVLSMEEQAVLKAHMRSVPFTEHQKMLLKSDFKSPPNVEAMYKKVTQKEHQMRFCVLARTLVWCEGDMDKQEKNILKRVGCLDSDEGRTILSQSRDDIYLQNYHHHYEKAGMVGLMKETRRVHINI